MQAIKVFNNNVVATITSDGKEAIVSGVGIGFQKKPGDNIEELKIDKYFFLQDDKKQKLYDLLERTPVEYFEITESILDYAKYKLCKDANDSSVIALTDHICFAIDRAKEGINLPNLILDETKALYKEEYKIGLWAIDYIEEKTGIRLSEDEAGYITIHIIDATYNSENSSAIDIIEGVKEIIKIIEYIFNIKILKGSLNRSRLVIHLKFFIQRIKLKEQDSKDFLDEMYSVLTKKHEKIELCVKAINRYVKKEYNYTPSKSETVYLMIHILKIINDKGL